MVHSITISTLIFNTLFHECASVLERSSKPKKFVCQVIVFTSLCWSASTYVSKTIYIFLSLKHYYILLIQSRTNYKLLLRLSMCFLYFLKYSKYIKYYNTISTCNYSLFAHVESVSILFSEFRRQPQRVIIMS